MTPLDIMRSPLNTSVPYYHDVRGVSGAPWLGPMTPEDTFPPRAAVRLIAVEMPEKTNESFFSCEPDRKNSSDQACSCLRAWRLSTIICTELSSSLEPLEPSQHLLIAGFEGGSLLRPSLCRETPVSNMLQSFFSCRERAAIQNTARLFDWKTN